MSTSTSTLPANEPLPRSSRRPWLILLGIAVVVVGFLFWRSHAREQANSAATAGARPGAAAGAGRAAADNRPVPVVLATVEQKDVPIFLEGLGTVAAYKTVTVRSRVDGQIQTMAFQEGQAVTTGTVLAQIDPRPYQIALHQAQAAFARDSAQLRGSKLNLERYAEVRKDKLIAQQQVDDQRAQVEQLEATVQSDQAQIENAKLQLDYSRITSPIDGVTGVRLVDPGNMVHAADQNGIVIVTQLDPIAVLFTLPQDDLQAVAEHMGEGKLTVDAWSRDGQTNLGTGELALIDNQINSATSTIRLKAIFPNPKKALWPNAFVKARLRLTTSKGAHVIPAVAVQRGPKGAFVYVVDADKKAQVRPVEVASVREDFAVIGKGLQPGEQVVVDGQSQLRPGATIQTKAPEGAGGGQGSQQGRGRVAGNSGAAGGPDADRRGGGGARKQKQATP